MQQTDAKIFVDIKGIITKNLEDMFLKNYVQMI